MFPATHLGGDIIWCATKCCSSGLSKHFFLAHAKVCYLDVSVLVQHHVVQLQISVETGHTGKDGTSCHQLQNHVKDDDGQKSIQPPSEPRCTSVFTGR